MPSLNKIMNMWHAYKRVNKRREHYGYYSTREDAVEAESLGKKTDKAWTANDRADKKAATIVKNLVAGLDKKPVVGHDD